MAKRIRQQRMLNFFLTVLVMATICGGVVITSNAKQDHTLYKYYTSIQVAEGDSLWTIAKTYCDEENYQDYNAFIMEVKQLNHMTGDSLYIGEYLTIPYYSADLR